MRRVKLTCGLLALALAGCAGYQLGPTTGFPAGARSIQVRPFDNQTLEPRLTTPVTHAMRRTLQQDGSYRLATGGDADIILTGVITHFDRGEIAFQPADVITPRDYHLSVTARITAVERLSGRSVFNQPVRGETVIRVGSDLTAAERQAVPLLAEDLARRATQMLVDGEW